MYLSTYNYDHLLIQFLSLASTTNKMLLPLSLFVPRQCPLVLVLYQTGKMPDSATYRIFFLISTFSTSATQAPEDS